MEDSRWTHLPFWTLFHPISGPGPISQGGGARLYHYGSGPRGFSHLPTTPKEMPLFFFLSIVCQPQDPGSLFPSSPLHVIRRKPLSPGTRGIPGGSLFHLAIPRGPLLFCNTRTTRRWADEATETSLARTCRGSRRSPKVSHTPKTAKERRKRTNGRTARLLFDCYCFFSRIHGNRKKRRAPRDDDVQGRELIRMGGPGHTARIFWTTLLFVWVSVTALSFSTKFATPDFFGESSFLYLFLSFFVSRERE